MKYAVTIEKDPNNYSAMFPIFQVARCFRNPLLVGSA